MRLTGVVVLAAAASCGDVPALGTAPTSSADAAATILVSDEFTRTVPSGWGTADVGGPWRIDSPIRDQFRVGDGTGQIVAPDNRPRNAVATEGYGLDVTGRIAFAIDRVPDNPGRFYTIQVYARRDDRASDGDNYYRFRLRAFGTGTMDLRLQKNVGGSHTWISDAVRVPVVWRPGVTYWIRWEAAGRSPTALRMRAWADGSPEPSTWHVSTTVHEPALDVAGTTGIRVEGPNADQVTFPVTFRFDHLTYATTY